MGLTRAGFLRRLNASKAVNCIYQRGELEGLISAWMYGDRFVLTWEECPAGGQYDESTYTRDERHEFSSAEEVLAFVERSGCPASAFEP